MYSGPGSIINVVIRDGEHILLEITSSMKKTDIVMYNRSAEEYQEKTRILPRIMVAAIYISPTVYERNFRLSCSYLDISPLKSKESIRYLVSR